MHWIEKQIKEHGGTCTRIREEVSSFILDSEMCTFKAQDLIEALPHHDRVSIYRTIDFFEKLDIIHPTIVIDGSQYYELHNHDKHHHHSFCNGCGTSECETCPMKKKQQKHHTLFYTFTCVHCK